MKCYICRTELQTSHPKYPRLCQACGEENLAWRQCRKDLSGYVALVTGARIKVGYHVALRLLREGADVIATTRFPALAWENYAREPDFSEWGERLHLMALDLLRLDLLERFFGEIAASYDHVDILVNNAALTVKQPDEKRLELAEIEARRELPTSRLQSMLAAEPVDGPILLPDRVGAENTWIKHSSDISIQELLETQLINVVGPYLLATTLKPMMTSGPVRNRFIINVSSVEGKFSVTSKSSAHPHTNMAKAALNMMTVTLAREYRASRIGVYSVDPGWVSDQFPPGWQGVRDALPLDFDDAASRVVHPILAWADDPKPPTGIFLKDYHSTDW